MTNEPPGWCRPGVIAVFVALMLWAALSGFALARLFDDGDANRVVRPVDVGSTTTTSVPVEHRLRR